MSDDPKWSGTPYAGGWGEKIDGEGNDHISITNEKSDDGPGFHITSETGKGVPNVRDYFDNDGNYLGSSEG